MGSVNSLAVNPHARQGTLKPSTPNRAPPTAVPFRPRVDLELAILRWPKDKVDAPAGYDVGIAEICADHWAQTALVSGRAFNASMCRP